MASLEQLNVIRRGVPAWNEWQRNNPTVSPELRGADLRGAKLSGALLVGADLTGADLGDAVMTWADLGGADLTGAILRSADLRDASFKGAHLVRVDAREANLADANLAGADLTEANLAKCDLSRAFLPEANLLRANLADAMLAASTLSGANVRWVDLSRADLADANLMGAHLVGTYLDGANLTGSHVYGIAAWDVRVDAKTRQNDLVITPAEQASISVDSVDVAQFIYLLVNNRKIREVIDGVTSKVVLILGRFTASRMRILEGIKRALRTMGFTPVLFDWETPASKDVTGTVETIARMARFILADLTDPRSIPHELATIVPFLRTTPVVLLRESGADGYTMADDLLAYPWVREVMEYPSGEWLIERLADVIRQADGTASSLRSGRVRRQTKRRSGP